MGHPLQTESRDLRSDILSRLKGIETNCSAVSIKLEISSDILSRLKGIETRKLHPHLGIH